MNLKFIVAVFATTLITGGLSYRRKSMGYTRYRLPSATNSDKLTGRVVNGHDVYPGEIPYQLFLQITRSTVSRKGKICGAALVETYGVQFALTAAHCVHLGYPTPFSAVSPKNVRITAGAHDIKHSSGNEQVRIPTKLVLHEQYDKYDDKTLHDIAILFYANPFKYNDYVKTIQLPEYMWKLPGKNLKQNRLKIFIQNSKFKVN
ncbi:unnamed protein product [Orchesella dallaii]|uniref:Peptidase S1 domain-containing protein n=1 Tax=Orchesella dallaii TaxID=48710 RepID=A0ABP1RQ19_9HEXA